MSAVHHILHPSIKGGSRLMPKFIYIGGSSEIPPDAYVELILSPTFTEALLYNPNAYGETINSPTFAEGTSNANANGELIDSPIFVEGSIP